MAARIEPGPYRDNLVILISNAAARGLDDPTIATWLGITAGQVGHIRRDAGIEPGDARSRHFHRRVAARRYLATTPEDPR